MLLLLNVLYTGVLAEIRAAIRHLPKLQILKCYDSVQVVSEMFRNGSLAAAAAPQDFSSQQPDPITAPQLLLKDLYCFLIRHFQPTPYERGSLSTAIQICPFVVHVHIEPSYFPVPVDYAFQDEDLLALLHLKNLRHLVLGHVNVSFDGGIRPILEKFGKESLEIFELIRLNDIDIPSIVRLCSNLRTLKFNSCDGPMSHQPSTFNVAHPQLLHLNTLEFIGWEPTSATLSLLLLSCPVVVKLKLFGLIGLTDQVIEWAANHGFSKLEELILFECFSITKTSIDLLLTLESPLKCITISRCQHFSENGEYVPGWQKKADEKNWKLLIFDRTDV